jgi:hypothetical protein
MKKKAGRPTSTVETFADGSSLETCPDGSVLLREGGLAGALAVRSEAGAPAAAPARQVRYDEPPPWPANSPRVFFSVLQCPRCNAATDAASMSSQAEGQTGKKVV